MKTFKTALLSTLAALGMTGGLYAAEVVDSLAETVTLSANTEYELSADTIGVTSFTLNEGSVLDLKGHNFTLTGKFICGTSLCVVTNSDETTTSTITLNCRDQNSPRFGAQMTNVTFRGNVKLHLNANPMGNDRAVGFGSMESTHTGGTVLEGYVTDKSDSYASFSKTNAFGYGALTLKGGSLICYNGGSDVMFPWPAISSELSDGHTATTNYFYNNAKNSVTITGAVDVSENTTLHLFQRQNTGGKHFTLSGPLSSVKGTLSLKDAINNSRMYLANTDGMKDGALVIGDKTDVRLSKAAKDSTYCIGSLSSSEDVTGENDSYLRYDLSYGYRLNLSVGWNNQDSTFWGHINKNGDQNIALYKVGTGTLTLGGVNNYSRHTEISNGVLRVIGAGTVGNTNDTGNIVFAGGTLAFGDGDETPAFTNYAARIKNSTIAPISIDTGSSTIVWDTALDSSNTGGLTKKGSGTLTLSAGAGYSGATRVEAGALVFGAAFDASSTTIVADDLAAAAQNDYMLAATSFANQSKPTLATTDPQSGRYRLVRKTVTIGGVDYVAYGIERRGGFVLIIQ